MENRKEEIELLKPKYDVVFQALFGQNEENITNKLELYIIEIPKANVNAETLRVIESLKGLNRKLKILKKPNKETLEAIIESEKIIDDIKKGKRKPYNSWKEAKKAMLNV